MKSAPLCLLILFASPAFAQEQCASVIALSKIVSTSTSSESDVENHASNFCSEYSRHRSDSTTYNFGASYEFLSASFGSGHASADDVASKFCSSDSSGHASAGAYQSYIENIAPGAYGAYAKCLQLKDNSIEFSIPEATVLKDQFVLTLTFKPAGKKVLVSSPLHPKGYLVVGISATNLAERLSQSRSLRFHVAVRIISNNHLWRSPNKRMGRRNFQCRGRHIMMKAFL